MSDMSREKKLSAAKKKLKKFQTMKAPQQPEKLVNRSLDSDRLIQGLQSNHIFKTPPLIYPDKGNQKKESQTPSIAKSTVPTTHSPNPPQAARKLNLNLSSNQPDASMYFSPSAPSPKKPSPSESLPPNSSSHLEVPNVQAGSLQSSANSSGRNSPARTDGQTDLTEVEAADLQQSLISYKRSNQVLVSQVNEQRKQLLQLQEKLKKGENSGKSAQDQKALKEQLEIHIQTIGILVQEKSDLQSTVATLQKKLHAKEAEIRDINDKLQALRHRIVELERMVTALQAGLDKQSLVNKDVVQERDRLSSRLYEVSCKKDEVVLQNSELQEKLQSKVNECSMLIDQINQLNVKLQKAELMAQQLSANSSNSVSAENWQKERELLIKALDEQKNIVGQLVSEKAYLLEKESDTQEHYDSQVEYLKNKINSLESREHELVTQTSTLQQEVTSLQQIAAEKPELEERIDIASEEQATVIENLTNERQTLENELDIQIKENRRLGRKVIDLEQEIIEKQEKVRQLGEESQDKLMLLNQIQADKETISRALQQNKELKEQLEELQAGFIKISNTSAELTTKLESEQHGNIDMGAKLSETQIELEETKMKLKGFNSNSNQLQDELSRIKEECSLLQQKLVQKEMDMDLLSTECETVKVELNSQLDVNEDLQKKVQQSDLTYKLQNELQSAQDTINTLSNQNDHLKTTLAEMQDEIQLLEENQVIPEDSEVSEADETDIDSRELDRMVVDMIADEVDNGDEEVEEQESVASSEESVEYQRDPEDVIEISTLQSKLQHLQDERMKILELLQEEREKSFNAVQQVEEHISLQVSQRLDQKQRELREHYYQETEALQFKVTSLQEALEIMRKNEEIDEFDVASDGITMPALKTAFMQLQKRYKEQMDVRASLSDTIEELEHKNTQLELETETIGEYITLYQSQRQALKDRFEERDQVIAKLSNEHGRMQNKVTQLHQLVMQLLSERSGVETKNKHLQEMISRRLTFQSTEEIESAGTSQAEDKYDSMFGEIHLTPDGENNITNDDPDSNTEEVTSETDQTAQQIMNIFEQLETTGEGYQHGWLSPAARKHKFAPCQNCSDRVINL